MKFIEAFLIIYEIKRPELSREWSKQDTLYRYVTLAITNLPETSIHRNSSSARHSYLQTYL